MNRMSTDALREKEILNLCDGTRLGYACDFELDVSEGRVSALIVPRSSGLFGLLKECDLVIPWDRIECVGEDAILVRLPKEELSSVESGERAKRKGKR